MPRTKNNFLNAKPVSKMGGGSGGVRKPGKPYQKPPAAKKATPKVKAKAAKPSVKAADPWNAPTPKNSRTSAPKSNTTFRTGNTPITLPNSKRAGKNLPNAAASKIRKKTKDVRPSSKPPVKPSGNFKAPSIPKPTAAPKTTPKPIKAPGLLGRIGRGYGPIQAGMIGAELATQAGYARGGKNYKEFVRAQDKVPAKPAKPAAKTNKPALGSTGARVSDKANQRDYKAAPTGSKQYNDYRNRQIAGERERLKNVGNPPKPKAKPPAPAADQRRSGGGGGNNTAPRSQTPSKPAPGRKWEDFNPGRGTSKSNNPLLDSNSGGINLRDRMKQREANAQGAKAMNLSNKFGQDSGYQPKTRVDGSKYADKKPDMKKVNEYNRRKRRYYD